MTQHRLPTFLCIGIQKAGTSWLYSMLRQHPEIFTSSPKELHFFNREPNFRRGLSWYASHFAGAGDAKACGEFTPDYLWFRASGSDDPEFAPTPDVAARIAGSLPDAKFLVILRDPVHRAVSSYFHHIGAARLDPNRRLTDIGDEWGILSMGYYADHLSRWFEHFPKDRFLVMIYEEELVPERRAETIRKVCEHIGVDSGFTPENLDRRYNKRRSPFDYRLSRLSGRVQNLARKYTPSWIEDLAIWDIPVEEWELQHLREHYHDKNVRLARLLDRPLPW